MEFDEIRTKAIEKWEALTRQEGIVLYYGAASCGRASGVLSTIEVIQDACQQNELAVKFVETGCIGPCYLEPLVAVQIDGNDPVFFSKITTEKASEFVDQVLVKGNLDRDDKVGTLSPETNTLVGERINSAFEIQVRNVLRNCGIIDPREIDHYIARDGYLGLQKALFMSPDDVIELVLQSGLRGRGGAGFPTGLKWKTCRAAPGEEKYAICNGDEGDPGAFMNRSLIEGDPHAVLEGLAIMSYAIGAHKAFLYIRAEYPLAIERLTRALTQMQDYHLAGENILNSGFNLDFEIFQGAGAFVCGEETALIASIMGKRGMPSPKPPYPATSGLWEKPTTINNVETMGTIPNILRNGADWFKQVGTEKSPGTKTFSLVGKIQNRGLIEVPLGTNIIDLIEKVGGGIKDGKIFKAIQTGGPSGGMIPAEMSELPLDYEALTQAGSIMGSGGLIVLDADTCVVDLASYFSSFTQRESCGKCVPCRIGTTRMLEILQTIKAGKATLQDLENLKTLAKTVKNTSLCGLGQGAPNPILTSLKYFEDEYLAHVEKKQCPALVCRDLIRFEINQELCNGCGLCSRNCPRSAIEGEQKQSHEISQELCIQCGRCYESCPVNAIYKTNRYPSEGN